MMTSFRQTLRGHITQQDKARSDYFYLPFELPAPASRLQVAYHYSAAMSSDAVEGGNVIDLGLFDPCGAAFPGGAGFRGWSGSARPGFTIGRAEATPGYLPGPLPAGQYQLILGLYRIWAPGADYTVEISAELTAEDTTPEHGRHQPVTPIVYPPQATGPATQWLCGDLQSHTYHSDAQGSPAQLVAKARAAGLDFLAITDHNTISHHAHLAALAGDDLLLLPGQEVTTYYGHMNIWGAQRWCDFRCNSPTALAAIIALAHAHGGVCSINHPKQGGPAWEYGFALPVDTMEVWQGPWPHRNQESLALWDRLLCEGRRLPAVGGSDYHCPSDAETDLLRIGQPTTWVKVRERTLPGILEALYQGRSCISAGPTGPRLDLTATAQGQVAGMGECLHMTRPLPAIEIEVAVWQGRGYQLQIIADGKVRATTAITDDEQRVHTSITAATYLRAELVGDMPAAQLPAAAPSDLELKGWRWALSNPVYIQCV